MVKILLAILLSSFLTTSIVSCSFLKSNKDETAQEVTESDDEGFGEEEGEDSADLDEEYDPLKDEDSDIAAMDDEGEGFGEDDFDDSLDEDFEEEGTDLGAVADTTDPGGQENEIEEISDDDLLGEDIDEGGDAFADNSSNPADDVLLEDEPEQGPTTIAENDVATDLGNDVTPAPPEEALAPDDYSNQGSVDLGYDDPEPVKTYVSVKKAKVDPFNKNGVLANAIYLARSGDTLSSISQKIYGSDRTDDLLKVNTTLGRGVKVGDKVYYNSPQRPNDNSRLLTYYEDLNLSPEIYVTQPGDNIRTVSKRLLGDSGSWKEVWATNPNVDSKGDVPEGLELRYWSDGGPAVAMNIASNNTPSPMEASQDDFNAPPPPPPAEDFNAPPPPPEPIAQNELEQIPPPPPEQFNNDPIPPPPEPLDDVPPPPVAAVEPPPPPPRVNAPPPPPKQAKNDFKSKAKSIASTADKDQKMMMGALAIILLAAVLLFIIIRKKRARRAIDFNTSTTQIE